MPHSITLTHSLFGELEVEYDIERADPSVGLTSDCADITSVCKVDSKEQLTLTEEQQNWIREQCNEAIDSDDGSDNFERD